MFRSSPRLLHSAALPAVAAIAALALTACSPTASAASVKISSDTVILDVRTPEEHVTGHLNGARLLDFNGGEVARMISSLDPNVEYLVYCRSGNRSGQAIALMAQHGFTNLTNLGSLEEAATATGLETTRD